MTAGKPNSDRLTSGRRAKRFPVAILVYGATVTVLFVVLLRAPDAGPSLGPGLQTIGLTGAFAAPGVAAAISRTNSDLQALMGGTVLVSSTAAGVGGSLLGPFGLIAGIALIASARGPISSGSVWLVFATLGASCLQFAAYAFAFRADWLGTSTAILLSLGLVLIAPRLVHRASERSAR